MTGTSYQSRLGNAPEEAVKAPCVTHSVANIILSGEQTVNGTPVTANQRVLVAAQTIATENGIYNVSKTAWTRAGDWDQPNDMISGQLVLAGVILFQITYAGDFELDVTEVTLTNYLLVKGAAGVDAQVQFNTAGLLDASSGFTFNKATSALTIGGNLFVGNQIQATGNVVAPTFNDVAITDSLSVNVTLRCDGTYAAIVPVTLNASTATTDTLSLVGQELEVNLATGSTHGAMPLADKTKMDFISITQGVDLDAIELKLDWLTVTQPVDLDALELRVNQLDAAVVLQGIWDASSGTFPTGGTDKAGDSWIVDVGDTVDGVVFTKNDRVVALVDSASSGTYAGNWHKLDYTDEVLSVFGRVGAVTAVSGDYTSTLITNSSTVAGGFVTNALDNLLLNFANYLDKTTYDTTLQGEDVYDKEFALGLDQVTGGIIDLGSLTADQDDWLPTDFTTNNVFLVDPDVNNREITGLTPPPAGIHRVVTVINMSQANDLRFTYNDGASTASHRFYPRDAAQKSAKPNEAARWWYNHSISRWMPWNRVG